MMIGCCLYLIQKECRKSPDFYTMQTIWYNHNNMAYNALLAERVRKALSRKGDIEEKKMMGGLTFMVNGKMCVGVLEDDLMARIDQDVYETSLQRIGAREMNFTGKPMKGFVFINPEGTDAKQDLDYWINLALDFNEKAKASKKKRVSPK